MLSLLKDPTRFLFFTGKGGVGKTSLAAAVTLSLAHGTQKVLLVSTDAATNLGEILGVDLKNTPVAVPGALGLFVVTIEPHLAANLYRSKVLSQMPMESSEAERVAVQEQLSGACTTEIAVFEEFANLLTTEQNEYAHIIFDTAPTGHTLRLLSLPKAWSGFLKGNPNGASCLGPHSGLKIQEQKYLLALEILTDALKTKMVLVTRPEKSALFEVARTSKELKAMGLNHQRLVINGIFGGVDSRDEVARSMQQTQTEAIHSMPKDLKELSKDQVALRSYEMVGLASLKALLISEFGPEKKSAVQPPNGIHAELGINALVENLAIKKHGLILVMGKGGVGKTTLAASLAIGLVDQGQTVLLSTTDPAAHLLEVMAGSLPGLRTERIDPKVETERYIEKIMASQDATLNEAEKALLWEDLQSPFTEEVAVFHAFSKLIGQAQHGFVVLDTAPTGHSLLLMDATGAYHRQALHDLKNSGIDSDDIVTPLVRLQNPESTFVILVSLLETTPVSQAAELQEDLRRANIEPYAWVINKSILDSGTTDPLLLKKMETERTQLLRIKNSYAKRIFVLPWQAEPPVGLTKLRGLVLKTPRQNTQKK